MANPGPQYSDPAREGAGVAGQGRPEDLGVPLVPTGGGAPGVAGGAGPGVPATVEVGPGDPGAMLEPSTTSGTPSTANGRGHTRTSATWTAVAAALVFLVIVVVFLLENLQRVRVTFFGAHWSVPLAVDLLLAVVLGGLIVFCVGAVRILQVRLQSRRQQRSLGTRRHARRGSAQVAGS
ncbi:MAG TPA: lipopolysaccharide assembly protein LapA domain-containing protein [Acidimicrobiales bacterium]|nr:lipopolysaccharide assembly protein LapA domain-containing protein [Acidimicrobiales bacterium]